MIPLVVVLGPTASGKTRLAIDLAGSLDGEVISADALATYQELNICSAKPDLEERKGIPHHGLDLWSVKETGDAARWLEAACSAIVTVHQRGRLPIVAGGTPLYVRFLLTGMTAGPPRDEALRKSLTDRYAQIGASAFHGEVAAIDQAYARERHPNDARRLVRAMEVYQLTGRPYSEHHLGHEQGDPRWRPFLLHVDWPKAALHERIARRVDLMFERGLVEEIRCQRPHMSREAAQAVGAKELFPYLDNRESLATVRERIVIATRHLAKHQATFFQRFPPMVHLAGCEQGLTELAVARLRDWQRTWAQKG